MSLCNTHSAAGSSYSVLVKLSSSLLAVPCLSRLKVRLIPLCFVEARLLRVLWAVSGARKLQPSLMTRLVLLLLLPYNCYSSPGLSTCA